MGKKSRRNRVKQTTEYKTEQDRTKEVKEMKEQFLAYGFKSEDEGIADIFTQLETFKISGDSWSGKIKIPNTKYKANIMLTNNKNKLNNVKLEYDKSCK
tara:strand:+ start:236 stop:532 length:297 start_codon:yes stop_codon:yes gene_type:complete